MDKKVVIIEHNDGDFTKKGHDGILLANLRIRGGKNPTGFCLPCLKELEGKTPKRLTLDFEIPVDLKSSSDSVWDKAVNLAKMNLGDTPGWSPAYLKPMGYTALMHQLNLDDRTTLNLYDRTTEEDYKKFNEMLEKYRDEINDHDERWWDDIRKKEQELGPVQMQKLNLNEVSDILKKYPDEDQALMTGVIIKVLDEKLDEQLYGEKEINEQMKIITGRVEDARQEKTRKYRRK